MEKLAFVQDKWCKPCQIGQLSSVYFVMSTIELTDIVSLRPG